MGPDLIYLPENAFDIDAFLSDVKAVCDKNNNKCIVAVSEGIRDKDGRYIGEFKASSTDLFGHAQLGGVGSILAGMVKEKLGIKVRAVEFSIIQRCAAHLASKNDVEEAFAAGAAAVKYAIEGNTDKMVILKRADSKEYKCTAELMDLSLAANTEKKIPAEWILPAGKGMTQEFIDYALPLIQGDAKAPLEDGLPRFAKLKKVPARK
jgi:6-phosphofructokinase 1